MMMYFHLSLPTNEQHPKGSRSMRTERTHTAEDEMRTRIAALNKNKECVVPSIRPKTRLSTCNATSIRPKTRLSTCINSDGARRNYFNDSM